MAVTDPIADMLTRIRNAGTAKQKTVSFPGSRLKQEICRILMEGNFIKKFVVLDDGKQGTIKVLLHYHGGENVIKGLERISRPGRRVYRSAKEIPRVLNGLGIAIVSTPRGVMVDSESRKNKIGGEILCQVW
jgi:small subunit ribosomal protein S8